MQGKSLNTYVDILLAFMKMTFGNICNKFYSYTTKLHVFLQLVPTFHYLDQLSKCHQELVVPLL